MLSAVWKRGAALTSAFLLCGGISSASSKAAQQLPNGPGKATVKTVCSGCHPAEIVMSQHHSKQGWAIIVSNMVDKGAAGTDAEFNTIIDYLAKHFPKKSRSSGKQT